MKYKNDGRVQVESNDSNKNLVDLISDTNKIFEIVKKKYHIKGSNTISKTFNLNDIWEKFDGTTGKLVVFIKVETAGFVDATGGVIYPRVDTGDGTAVRKQNNDWTMQMEDGNYFDFSCSTAGILTIELPSTTESRYKEFLLSVTFTAHIPDTMSS